MGIALEKSRKFAVRVYNLNKYLCSEKREYVLAKQLLRSGTSIGANLTEAQYAVSKKEFLAKAAISLKECAETKFWLDLLKDTNVIPLSQYESIMADCKELLKLLISTVKMTRERVNQRTEYREQCFCLMSLGFYNEYWLADKDLSLFSILYSLSGIILCFFFFKV